jgi:hypothetical protein
MILVPLLNPKFATALAEMCANFGVAAFRPAGPRRRVKYPDKSGTSRISGRSLVAWSMSPVSTYFLSCFQSFGYTRGFSTQHEARHDRRRAEDAERSPRYRQLEPALEVSFLRKLRDCEIAWRETGEPLAVAEAMTWTFLYAQTPAEWLEEAVVTLAVGRRTPEQAERHREVMRHAERYCRVRDLRREGLTKDEALDRAAEELEAARATIEKSYAQVRKDFSTGIECAKAKYFPIKDKRYLDADESRKPD